MHTRVVPVGSSVVDDAATILTSHIPVAVPTETVYGLAARYDDEKAVRQVFAIKRRPADNPLIVHLCATEQLSSVAKDIPDAAFVLAKQFWPGPLTIVLHAKHDTPWTTAGCDTIAVRVPDNAFLRSLIQKVGPLAAPSANLSGKPSPTTAQHVLEDLAGKIPLIVDGGACKHGLESTVVDLTGAPAILRPGAITKQELEAVLGTVIDGGSTASPGTKHTHYTPNAVVEICEDIPTRLAELASEQVMTISRKETGATSSMVYDSPEVLGAQLFSCFRKADAQNINVILVEPVAEDGIGAAVMNRLRKAAKRS